MSESAERKMTARTKFYIDTEFIESGPSFPLILLSIGIVEENGRELYLVNADAPLELANDWVRKNVIPYLGPSSTSIREFGAIIHEWIGVQRPEFWGYYADYDWVVFCQIFGSMIDLPKGWPMFCRDIKQLCVECGDPELPEQSSTEHNALNDARWNKLAHEFLLASSERREPPGDSYPKPCGICAGIIQSSSDLDWHGYGNCRDIPDIVMADLNIAQLLRDLQGHIAGELGERLDKAVASLAEAASVSGTAATMSVALCPLCGSAKRDNSGMHIAHRCPDNFHKAPAQCPTKADPPMEEDIRRKIAALLNKHCNPRTVNAHMEEIMPLIEGYIEQEVCERWAEENTDGPASVSEPANANSIRLLLSFIDCIQGIEDSCFIQEELDELRRLRAASVSPVGPEPKLKDQKCDHGMLPEWCDQCTVQQKYEWSKKVWAEVVKSSLFDFLKHQPLGRTIMRLFGQGQISLGKAAESIVEAHELGLSPKLPELKDDGEESIIPTAVGPEPAKEEKA